MDTTKKDYKNKIIIFLTILIIISFFAGFSLGVSTTINTFVNMASGFIHIDKELIKIAFYQYKNNIGECFPANLTI